MGVVESNEREGNKNDQHFILKKPIKVEDEKKPAIF
jgi:hypothetical protein